MATNPLLNRNGPTVTRDLDEFVEQANQNWFVKDSGKPYFVNSKVDGSGQVIRFMDRRA